MTVRTGLSGSRLGAEASSCENGNEPYGKEEARNILTN